MNLIFSEQTAKKNENFEIFVNSISDFEKYLLCLKDKMFDLVFADISQKDMEFFFNLKNLTKMSKLLKSGSELRLAFQFELSESQQQKLKQIFSILDLTEVQKNNKNLIFRTKEEKNSEIQEKVQLQQIKVKVQNPVFGFSTFDDVIKIEPGQNPFAKLVANGEQVNEDLLLKNDVLEVKKEAEDCSTRVTACKNCTCKKSTVNTGEDLGNLKSNCGNCYLGDAFRCQGCPFRGQPAFKPGDRIKIDLSSTTLTVFNNYSQETGLNETVIKQGKIKIEL